MTTLHTLASGSSGNALLVSHGGTHILVDAGISCRRICTALRALGLSASDLTALLITHCHSDHIAGLQTLLKRSPLPVYATPRTCRELTYRYGNLLPVLTALEPMEPRKIGDCLVTAIPTSHDCPGSCGYRLDTSMGGIGILTDTGYVTPEAHEALSGVSLALLETNHDVETLRSGPYPYYLKNRILGREGHLSNADAAAFAVELAQSGANQLILAHLSRENNTPAMAHAAVELALGAAGLSPALFVAPRLELSRAYSLEEALCKR